MKPIEDSSLLQFKKNGALYRLLSRHCRVGLYSILWLFRFYRPDTASTIKRPCLHQESNLFTWRHYGRVCLTLTKYARLACTLIRVLSLRQQYTVRYITVSPRSLYSIYGRNRKISLSNTLTVYKTLLPNHRM